MVLLLVGETEHRSFLEHRSLYKDRLVAESQNGFELEGLKRREALKFDLIEQREYQKQMDDRVTKDGLFNPNRAHANCHSSKINNRERSRKKRQQKKKHRRSK